ncbi:MAG: hypothetical protein D5R96_08410 [Methanocalculus sp. MSAO_Arc2]|uniref:class I SAM-dependent methyltransferase n=1 Tax=Methanocalculus sp. MSAO_Arc2 TaxID=2293855 RepID=UPI000FEE2240|nr:MAG: hypothetical protein D5R96_08410 [Methanocalculus sp. MSAO_Arc2]
MEDQKTPYPVSDTAALVMLWARSYYEEVPLIRRYMEQLDLKVGIPLLERYNLVCPWYSEVIVNRKHFIKNAVLSLVGKSNRKTVIANLGAGFSPLAIELLDRLSPDLLFMELDLENTRVKEQLYREIAPERSVSITCTTVDITDTRSLITTLKKGCGTSGTTRLIVVMEGLTYYIGRQQMKQVAAALTGSFLDLAIVFEHLKPCSSISSKRRHIPYDIFSHVRDYTGCREMTTYTRDQIEELFGPGFPVEYTDMDQMEQRRNGTQTYFPTPEDGWLSVAVLERR